MAWDRQLERWVVGHRVGFVDPVAEWLSHLGSYSAIWLAIAAVTAFALRRPPIFVSVLLAAALTEASTSLLKLLIPRARPELQGLLARPRTHSFPSGHSATSFACATVLAAAVPRARVPLLVLAALIAWSRVYVGVHYPLDVLAGAVIGVALGLLVLRAPPLLAAVRRRRRPAQRAG